MSTEIALRQPSLQVQSISEAAELAGKLSRTEFVPTALRGKPEAVLAAMLTGNEIGIGPMFALAKIDVIEGRPALRSELMRALVLSAGHDLWIDESTSTRCTISGQRSGSDHVSQVTFTLDDAKRAGLAGKAVWQKYPRAMLLARATGELCRSIFPDVLGGISYTPEEIEDRVFEEDFMPEEPSGTEESEPKKVTRTAKNATAKTSKRTTGPAEARQRPPAPVLPGGSKPKEQPPAGDGEEKKPMSTAQKIVLRCNQYGIDRADLADAVSGGRTRKCSELDEELALRAYEIAQAIGDGRAVLVETDDGPAISWDVETVANEDDEDIVDAELVEDDDDSSPSNEEAKPERRPPDPPAPSSNHETAWTTDQWREFLKARGVKVTEVLREAHRIAQAHKAASPSTLDELANMGPLATDLRGFVEDLSLSRGQ